MYLLTLLYEHRILFIYNNVIYLDNCQLDVSYIKYSLNPFNYNYMHDKHI